MTNIPTKSQIKVGSKVSVETKENQGTGNLTSGIVKDILTSSEIHPHGIKVRLEDDQVGRVKNMDTESNPSIKKSVSEKFEDLDKKEIPEIENQFNEFKEFYQFDPKLENQSDNSTGKQVIAELKLQGRKIMTRAVCSFANSYDGGFVYLGIKTDGTISGLERDLNLEGKIKDYDDSFANHIRDTLGTLMHDKTFIVSKLAIKFRNIDGKTICIIQVLPATQPVYLEDDFYVRGPSPRAEKLIQKDQFRYIKGRFPNYE